MPNHRSSTAEPAREPPGTPPSLRWPVVSGISARIVRPGVARITCPTDVAPEPPGAASDAASAASDAVGAVPDRPGAAAETSAAAPEVAVVADGAIRVEIGGSGVTVLDADGELICADDPAGGPRREDGGGRIAWVKRMPAGTGYFGLGERTGSLDKKGGRHTFWNTDQYEHQGPDTDSLYVSIPFYLAVDATGRCHGVLINSGARAVIDLSDLRGERLVCEVAEPDFDHYVIAGPSPEHVLRRLTDLTGRMPLPPRWALGYHHARWGYRDEADIRRVARRLRREGIPADVIYLDIDHQDGYRTFTWDRRRFPEPARLAADLREDGFKLAATVNVGVKYQPEGGYDIYDEGVRHDVFLRDPGDPGKPLLREVWPGPCVFPDFARERVRRWWGRWYERPLAVGVRVVVNDMNEPAMHDLPIDHPGTRAVDPPADTRHGPPGARTTHARIHNLYANLENQAAYTAWRRLMPGTRPLLLTRAGSTGVQRHAAVWTGDNRSLWEHLEMSLPQLLNLGLSGVPFVGADIGGFFGTCGPELLVRWYQLGAWYPLARANCDRYAADQEPWVWGPRVLDACRAALRRRYRLLPYWYTLFAEAARSGAPVLRPLLYHYPGDPHARSRDDEALLGRDLLLAPVLRPGRTTREVYLPPGRWYGLHDGRVHLGPAHILADAPLFADMPVYARAGAVIPTGPDVDHADQEPVELTLHVYPDEHGMAEGTLYEDDGSTMSHREGDFALTRYLFDNGTLSATRCGAFQPPDRKINLQPFDHDRRG